MMRALANIPPRCNRSAPICFSPYLYRARNLVERFFNKIKHCRRIATRYDKLAANYLAFVQLASIRLWLRVNESASLTKHLESNDDGWPLCFIDSNVFRVAEPAAGDETHPSCC